MTRILLVEDNEMNRDMLSRRLARKGYEVALAVDGRQGVEMAQTMDYDLVLMDIQMPVMNGFNAAVGVRAIEKAYDLKSPTPLIFFSSQPCDEKAKKVLQFCGRAIYVNKDASPNLAELAGRVEQVLINLLTKGTAT